MSWFVVYPTEDSTFWIEEGRAEGKKTGDFCLASYHGIELLEYISVNGIALEGDVNYYSFKTECFPIDLAKHVIVSSIESGVLSVSNWLLISANNLVTQLNLQSAYLVNNISGGGGGGGGFTSSDRNMLITIHTKSLEISQALNLFSQTAITRLNNLEAAVSNLQTDMILDHDLIIDSINAGSGITEDGLLSGIGDLLSAGWEWIAALISEFSDSINSILTWSSELTDLLATSFINQIQLAYEGLISGMAFISNEMFEGFNNVMQVIVDGLSVLGDVGDLFNFDIFQTLIDAFDFNEQDVKSVMEIMFEMVKASTQTLSRTLEEPTEP